MKGRLDSSLIEVKNKVVSYGIKSIVDIIRMSECCLLHVFGLVEKTRQDTSAIEQASVEKRRS